MTPPETIGPYKIISKLGEGGMGAVYRATDTKLNRDVAIKILPEASRMTPTASRASNGRPRCSPRSTTPTSRSTASRQALVMELVGQTRTLRRRPAPTQEALDIARQIAEALEAAHEKGIVHRDLKPRTSSSRRRRGQGARLRPRQGVDPATPRPRRPTIRPR